MTYPPPANPDPYGQQPEYTQPDPYAQNPYGYGSPATPGSPVAPASGQPQYAQPYSAQPYSGQPAAPYGQPAPYGGYQAPQQNTIALVGMILAILGVFTFVTAPIGAIMGHVSLKQIKQTGETGEGMAKAAIIVGWIATGLWVLGCCGYVGVVALLVNSTTSSY